MAYLVVFIDYLDEVTLTLTLGRLGEPEIRTVFIFSCATALGGAALALTQGADLFAMRRESIWLLAVGVFAVLGQLCITRAYRLGTTLVVANLQYSGLVFSALLGFLFLGETLSPLHWAGMALIIACGVMDLPDRRPLARLAKCIWPLAYRLYAV